MVSFVYPIWRRHLFRLCVHPEGDVNVTLDRSATRHTTGQDTGGAGHQQHLQKVLCSCVTSCGVGLY